MATLHDDFAKNVLDVMLDDLGALTFESQAPPLTGQRGDVRFVPSPARLDELSSLGLLGRIASASCLLEHFSAAPTAAALRECLRKLLHWRHLADLGGAHDAPQRSWLLCAGKPRGALRALSLRRDHAWPSGVYALGAAWGFYVVVLSELPATPDTLPLRLLGRGATRRNALLELRDDCDRAPRGGTLLELVVQVVDRARRAGAVFTETEMIDLSYARKLRQQAFEEGREEGREEGAFSLLRALVSARLGRPLREREASSLRARLHTDDAQTLAAAVTSRAPDELAAWLEG